LRSEREWVRSTRAVGTDAQSGPLLRDGGGPAGPLSFAQQRLWFIDRLAPGNPAYNVAVAVRLRGALDGDRLRAALGAVVDRHQVLRTTFPDRHGAPYALAQPSRDPVSLPVRDLEAGEVPARVEALAATPFDLAAGPLW
jgi:hypothetical protein